MKESLYHYNPWWEDSFKDEDVIPLEKHLIELKKHTDFEQIVSSHFI